MTHLFTVVWLYPCGPWRHAAFNWTPFPVFLLSSRVHSFTRLVHRNWHQAAAFTNGFFCSTWSCLPMDRHSLRVASWVEALGDFCKVHVRDCNYCLYTFKTLPWTWLHRLVIGDWSRGIANSGFIWEWYQDYLKKKKKTTEKGLGIQLCGRVHMCAESHLQSQVHTHILHNPHNCICVYICIISYHIYMIQTSVIQASFSHPISSRDRWAGSEKAKPLAAGCGAVLEIGTVVFELSPWGHTLLQSRSASLEEALRAKCTAVWKADGTGAVRVPGCPYGLSDVIPQKVHLAHCDPGLLLSTVNVW